MLSVFILFSNDRIKEAETSIECLWNCDGFDRCQKILCCDGPTDYRPDGFSILSVQRPSSKMYCWANMWEQAVASSVFEKILYLDSDRILPPVAIKLFEEQIQNNIFCFPRWLYSIREKKNTSTVKHIRDDITNHMHELVPDHRVWTSSWEAVRMKNPMSGCTGFTKTTFQKTGGLDKSFQGWGYPDTDYFEKTLRMGLSFVPLDLTELHLHHNYAVSNLELRLMNLWNGCYFCRKWGYPKHPRLKQVAKEVGIDITTTDRFSMKGFLNISTGTFL